jgi:hypothetical protein
VEQPGGPALEIRRRPGVEAKASAERGARGRGSQPRTREALGARPLLLRGAAFNGWTRLRRRRTKVGRIGGPERPSSQPGSTGPGTEIAAQWSAGRRLPTDRKEGGDLRKASHRGSRRAAGVRSQGPALAGAPSPRFLEAAEKAEPTRARPGPTSKTRAMMHA